MELNARPEGTEEVRDPQLSKLYRASGAPEPSADIDQALLALARREVRARPRRAASWLREWRVPLSIAATIVVSASLVMVMVDEGAHRMEEPPPIMAPAPARDQSPAPGTPPTDDLAARSPDAITPKEDVARQGASSYGRYAESDSVATRQALKSSPKREPASEARSSAEAPRAPPPAPPPATLARPFPAAPPAPEAEQRAAPRPETTPRAAEVQRRDAPRDQSAASVEAAPRRERTEDAVTAAPRPQLEARGFADAPLHDKIGERAGEGATRPWGAIGRAAPGQVPGVDPGAQESQDPARAESGPAPAAKRAPAMAKDAPKPRPQTRGQILARDLRDQPPEKWLERVEQLRREDRPEDADELLAEFRRRFPDHPASHKER